MEFEFLHFLKIYFVLNICLLIQTHMHTCTHTYIHIYIHIFIYIYIFISEGYIDCEGDWNSLSMTAYSA